MIPYEWKRTVSLRSTWVVLLIGVVASSIGAAGFSTLVWLMTDAGTTVSTTEAFSLTVTRSSTAPMVVGVLGLLSVAGDRKHGLLGLAALREPQRWRILVAKVVIVFGLGLGLGLVTMAGNAAVASLILGHSAILPSVGPLGLASVPASMIAAIWGWACLGVGIGLLVRSGIGAFAILLGVPLVVERALGALGAVGGHERLSRAMEYLPFRSASRLQMPLSVADPVVAIDTVSLLVAGTVFLGCATLVLWSAILAFDSNDLGTS